MSKGIIESILDSVFDAFFDRSEFLGSYGEKLTAKELKRVNFFGRKGKILRNVYLPKENGQTSEIDLLYITEKGIFVFESKNYSGWIFGDEASQYWTAMLPNRQKNRFYNPIKQNRTHMKWLRQCVGPDIPLFSIIVFSERCELKKVTVDTPEIKVIKRDRTYATMRSIWEQSPDALSEERAAELYTLLKGFTAVDKATKQAHIETIEKNYKTPLASQTKPVAPSLSETMEMESVEAPDSLDPPDAPDAPDTLETPERKICPRCGRELVLRTAKKGANAGNQFYGCSGFPKCRYIKNM